MSGNVIGRPMEILLVEDSLLQARLTYSALEEADFNHRLNVIRDGQDAVEFLFKVGKYARVPNPDLVLLDLRLPNVDGLEILTKIKQSDDLQHIPVVIMTASEDDTDRAQCEAAKVDAYLEKPVDTAKFLALIEELREHWKHKELILPARP